MSTRLTLAGHAGAEMLRVGLWLALGQELGHVVVHRLRAGRDGSAGDPSGWHLASCQATSAWPRTRLLCM